MDNESKHAVIEEVRAGEPRWTARPTVFADQAGTAYASNVTVDHRRDQGLYLTPISVADFMAEQITVSASTIRLLDPAAGAGILLCAAVEALQARDCPPRQVEVVAYEVDAVLAGVLQRVLAELAAWAAQRGTSIKAEVIRADFILAHAAALSSMGGFLPHLEAEHAFDVVIANPPYFKLNKADPRARAAATVVHGQPNIYGLFMAVGAALLRNGGEVVFITPRSFAAGPYFRLFREKFFGCIRPEIVHVFDSRRDAFVRDAVLQENIILKGRREDDWIRRGTSQSLTISTSQGLSDLRGPDRRSVPMGEVLDLASVGRVLRLPLNRTQDSLLHMVDAWPGTLRDYGLQISTGPVVPFRATELLDQVGAVPHEHVPLLWMNHITPMRVTWPLAGRKPEYIKHIGAARPLLVPNRNYVLLRRFSAKEERRRLTAAPYLAQDYRIPVIGIENHLNYVHRPGSTLSEEEAFGLAALFNSRLLDTYFRAINGNTQVNATELRAMPLPAHELIVEIGRHARTLPHGAEKLDELVATIVGATSYPERASAVG